LLYALANLGAVEGVDSQADQLDLPSPRDALLRALDMRKWDELVALGGANSADGALESWQKGMNKQVVRPRDDGFEKRIEALAHPMEQDKEDQFRPLRRRAIESAVQFEDLLVRLGFLST